MWGLNAEHAPGALAFTLVFVVRGRSSSAKFRKAVVAKAKGRCAAAKRARALAAYVSPAALAAQLGAPVVATFEEFGAYINRSSKTGSRMEPKGLPVIRPGRQPLVLVERALKWIEDGKPRPRAVGRPHNIDRGATKGGGQ